MHAESVRADTSKRAYPVAVMLFMRTLASWASSVFSPDASVQW
jgi:hypothetical protein